MNLGISNGKESLARQLGQVSTTGDSEGPGNSPLGVGGPGNSASGGSGPRKLYLR